MTHAVLLPGASGSIGFWQPLLDLLPAEYTVQIVGYPGFDCQPAQDDVYDFNSLSTYAVNQIQQKSVLIAQSMGGIFAVQAALQKPELIQGLVLIATSGGVDLSSFQIEDWRINYQQQFTRHPDWFVCTHSDYTGQMKGLNLPVLLLWGDADPISPLAVGRYLNRLLPNSQLQVIHGGDHQLAAQRAAEIAPNIIEFMNACELQG